MGSLTESEQRKAVVKRDLVDRSDWHDGPWDDEPDFVKWMDESTGLVCAVIRQNTGHLCGYVQIPHRHELFRVSPNSCAAGTSRDDHEVDESLPISAHGGVTFAGECPHDEYVEPGWWYGFDCVHAGDVAPGYGEMGLSSLGAGGSYRDMKYVVDECRSLADQVNELEGKQ